MTRFVEDIVAAHQAAARLRKAGRSPWPYKANIQAVLDKVPEEPSAAALEPVCRDIAKVLRASLPTSWFDYQSSDAQIKLIELIEELEEISAAEIQSMAEELGDTPADAIDNILSELYNWADVARVWLRA